MTNPISPNPDALTPEQLELLRSLPFKMTLTDEREQIVDGLTCRRLTTWNYDRTVKITEAGSALLATIDAEVQRAIEQGRKAALADVDAAAGMALGTNYQLEAAVEATEIVDGETEWVVVAPHNGGTGDTFTEALFAATTEPKEVSDERR